MLRNELAQVQPNNDRLVKVEVDRQKLLAVVEPMERELNRQELTFQRDYWRGKLKTVLSEVIPGWGPSGPTEPSG